MTMVTESADALRDAHSLERLYELLEPLSVNAGWNKPKPAMWPSPRWTYQPMHWHWEQARAALAAAGELVDTTLAERRNLILYNPVEDNTYATVRTLIAAYQMIRPGERARSHRHAANALRLVVEGEGAYTVVDGERIEMAPGDVVLTPGRMWHGHGNDGDDDCYWIDFLDVPLVQMLEPMFFEGHPEEHENDITPVSRSPFSFRWADIGPALKSAARDPLGRHGRLLELDAECLTTLRLFMQGLDAGERTTAFRTTAHQVFAVVAGSGRTVIDDREHAWRAGDVIAVPAWHRFHHQAGDDAVLFGVSDQRLQETLGFLRTSD